MSEYKGVEVANVKTDLNRICCPRPSAPAVTGRKDQQMHNMLGASTVTTVFMLMLESNQACHRCVNVCLHVDDICIYLFGLPSMIVLLASQNKSFGFLPVSPYVIWSLFVLRFFLGDVG